MSERVRRNVQLFMRHIIHTTGAHIMYTVARYLHIARSCQSRWLTRARVNFNIFVLSRKGMQLEFLTSIQSKFAPFDRTVLQFRRCNCNGSFSTDSVFWYGGYRCCQMSYYVPLREHSIICLSKFCSFSHDHAVLYIFPKVEFIYFIFFFIIPRFTH